MTGIGERMLMLLAAVNPWAFGAVFLVVLTVIVLVSRLERNAAVKPFERKAQDIGRVRCKSCNFEGMLQAQVKTQLGRSQSEPVPKVESCSLVCSQCESPDWAPLSGANP
jgi:hypothetical protein